MYLGFNYSGKNLKGKCTTSRTSWLYSALNIIIDFTLSFLSIQLTWILILFKIFCFRNCYIWILLQGVMTDNLVPLYFILICNWNILVLPCNEEHNVICWGKRLREAHTNATITTTTPVLFWQFHGSILQVKSEIANYIITAVIQNSPWLTSHEERVISSTFSLNIFRPLICLPSLTKCKDQLAESCYESTEVRVQPLKAQNKLGVEIYLYLDESHWPYLIFIHSLHKTYKKYKMNI